MSEKRLIPSPGGGRSHPFHLLVHTVCGKDLLPVRSTELVHREPLSYQKKFTQFFFQDAEGPKCLNPQEQKGRKKGKHR
jgi:hypothetical protein